MPDEVEIVRRALDAISRRDLDALLAEVGPEAVVDWSNSMAPYRGVYRGAEEIRRGWEENLLGTFDRVSVEAERIVELGLGLVVVGSHLRAAGRDGIEVEAHGGQIWKLREGKLVYGKLFQSFEEAIAEARAELGE